VTPADADERQLLPNMEEEDQVVDGEDRKRRKPRLKPTIIMMGRGRLESGIDTATGQTAYFPQKRPQQSIAADGSETCKSDEKPN
jgi:hypothetical protein